MKLSELHKKKWVVYIANALLLWITFTIFIIFIVMNKYSENAELFENFKQIIVDLNAPYIDGGIILTIGLFLMIIFKILKSHITIIGIGILTLIIYYLKMLWIGI